MNSRAKGQRGEREFCGVLLERWPHLPIARGLQARGGGVEVPDITGFPAVHFEVKRVESLNIWAALDQAERDAEPNALLPVVAFRRNRSDWYIAQPADDWFNLVEVSGIPYLL